MDRAIKTVTTHRIHQNTFGRDIAKFRIYIADLTHVQNAEVPEQQKFAYIKDLLTHDTRQCLSNALDLARYNKLDFQATLDLLITAHSIKMAAVSSIPNYCFDFQKGECTLKNAGIYTKS